MALYIKLDETAQLNTILAALRFWQQREMTDPANRDNYMQSIATNMGEDTSLDDEGVDALCERINSRTETPEVPHDISPYITVREGEQYGAKVYKPALDDAIAHGMCEIGRTKTFTPTMIHAAKAMGFIVRVEGKPEVTL